MTVAAPADHRREPFQSAAVERGPVAGRLLPSVRHPVADEAGRSGNDRALFEPTNMITPAILPAKLGFDDDSA